MKAEQAQVKEFMLKAGHPCRDKPEMPTLDERKLWAKLILEENLELVINGLGINRLGFFDLNELLKLLKNNLELHESESGASLVETADGICDSHYVTLGCANACGIQISDCFQEVQRSNLSKFIDGHKREDGKWIKGPSYSPANLEPIIQAQANATENVL
jgi:predicted HAD superfamily Cof-like phosphohydrolase